MANKNFTFNNSVYGRNITLSAPEDSTEEFLMEKYNKANKKTYSGDLVFDDLSQDEKYIKDAKINYKRREGKEWKGTDNQLVEEQFEYWNYVDNNLVSGATSAYDFSKMEKGDKQRVMRLFDIYDRTNMTGDGSRPFWEQLKGVGKAVVTDPTNLIGGAGIWKFIGKSATKGLSKIALQKVLFPAAIGATWSAVSNIERQSREVALEKKGGIEGSEVGTAALTGAVLGPVAGVVTRNVGRLAEQVPKIAKLASKKIRQQVKQDAQTMYVKTLGGGSPSAQRAVGEELAETIGKGDFAGGTTGAFDILTKKAGEIKSKFVERYTALGELNIRGSQLNKFVVDMEEAGINIPAARDVLQMLGKGEYTRTEALRELRSIMSDTLNDAYRGVGDMPKRWRILVPWEKKIKKLFLDSAAGANKLEKATQLDSQYSQWQKFQRNINGGGKDILNAGAEKTKLDTLITSLIATPSKSLSKWEKVISQVNKMGKWSKDETFAPEMRKFVLDAVKSELFQGKKPKILRFMEDDTGLKTLKNLFPKQKVMLDDLSVIYRNALEAGNNSVPLYWGRIIPAILGSTAGGMTGGPAGAAIGTAASLKGIEAAVNSPFFRKMAMNAYKNGKVNEKTVNGMMKWLEKKLKIGPDQLKAIRQNLVGTAVIGGGALIDESTTGGQYSKEAKEAVAAY
jgi:hypothetical protein